jgi:hypothetical protein
MANVKISALTALSTMTDATVVPVVESATTKKITGANLKNYFKNDSAGFEKATDQTVNGTVTFPATAYQTSGDSFGTMAGTGIFTFSKSGSYIVILNIITPGAMLGYGYINGSGTKYLRWYNSDANLVEFSISDVISVNANDTFQWLTNSSRTLNAETRINFIRLG